MPWITPIVFKQASDEALTRIPRFGDGPKSLGRVILTFQRFRELQRRRPPLISMLLGIRGIMSVTTGTLFL